MFPRGRRPLWRALAWIGVVNFVVFFFIASRLGGDAINGKAVAGHYYLGIHGKLTEVSRWVWTYSRVHVYSLVATHPLAMLGSFMSNREKRREERREESWKRPS